MGSKTKHRYPWLPALLLAAHALFVPAQLQASGTLQRQTPSPSTKDQETIHQDASPMEALIAEAHARAASLVARMTLLEKASQIKHDAPAIPRLGIPAYNWWSEGLHGVARAGEATVFPQAIGMAATWDVPLIQRTADVIATEFRAKYLASRGADGSSGQYRGLTVWSPNVNIFRDPRWGRGQETWGEDPYLTSRFGVAFIRGLQGDDPRMLKTLATVKHYAVHSGPEADRHSEDVHPSPQDLEDTYLPAFRAAVTEGRAEGLMCAYNAVDGVPACASPSLDERVRGDWGFKGHIVSDCAAIADFFKPDAHRWTRTPEEAAAAALKAGTDLFCAEFGWDKSSDPAIIVRAIKQKLLPVEVLDRAVTRLMAARIRLGLIDPPAIPPYAEITPADNDTPKHAALASEVARASLVLLKNDGLLPLKVAPQRIAVIGPNADNVDALVGNYNGTPSQPVTVLEGLRQRFPETRIDFVEGTGLTGAPFKPVPEDALCLDARCTARGVLRQVFATPTPAGTPTQISTEKTVHFSWGRPNREERNGSVRWSGWMTPPTSGAYRFQVSSFDGYRVTIDGKEVVNTWDAAEPSDIVDREIDLKAGVPVRFVIEARQKGSRGDQSLAWSGAESREDAAIAAARQADLVVFVGGLTAKLEGEEMRVNAAGFSGGDRTSLDLPANQEALLKRLYATGKPVVLVLMNGSALAVNWADAHLPAIIEAWYPGGTGGRAVADLIAGDFSPSGRLPVTFYRSAGDLPPFKDYAMEGRTYRYFRGKPLYPFGYGLSYTRFLYGPLRLSRQKIAAGELIDVTVRVQNVGARDGTEVAQLYVSHETPGAPIRALKGFQRIMLKKGEAKDVRFTLDPEALSVVDAQGHRHVPAGEVDIWVGGGQPLGAAHLQQLPGAAATLQVISEPTPSEGTNVPRSPFASREERR
ncbi:glycoside hydrolase family 3 C-terminal domain-containing protein [Pedomonas mirosovicensis]|uniref:glycoside hydrolase family 3 C-terminal domain-containing protein n=1 Tax=Pedomonas mirosovicensis TaxID=2908641 RepID=UPI00216A6EA8|nr:glycoside hydrolase family 3 C-terminal domain-containing protein [Pedomonas mirosovicensis]MCH8686722.1 glycoside hydrolase family 3 C-terminal domain-containing protein [Pedomonas mirosovicensis]